MKKITKISNEFDEVARYKITIQKFILYTKNELSLREFKNIISFSVTLK